MPHLTRPLTGQEVFKSSATQVHALGEMGHTRDGRRFRYVLAGATALVVGNVIQSVGQNTGHDQLTPSAAAIGDTSITVTPDSGAITAQDYADGWAVIDTDPGLGYTYRISSHPAWSSGTLVLQLCREDAIQVALTASSRVTLVANPYRGVIQAPITTLTGHVSGVAVFPITAAQYGWIQTRGVAGTLIAGTPGVGLPVSSPGSAAGAVVIDAGNGTTSIVGSMCCTGVDGKVLPVDLSID